MQYHSGLERFRKPFGAVPTNAPVTFTLVPEAGEKDLTAALSYTVETTGEEVELPCKLQADGTLSCTLPGIEVPGLVWYTFILRRAKQIVGFLCPQPGLLTGPAVCYREDRSRFQLTVYDQARTTPAWYGRGVTYHIFVDRFARKGEAPALSGRVLHENWLDTPEYRPDSRGEIWNNDFFGGNLQGIREKLPYLESMGVETLFLSPIFEAFSNHRYDTADYEKIDPMLGTEQDFRELCADAAARGIRVILDGVFNHTGCDSRYFNLRGKYETVGAAQSKDSPYYSWYDFEKWPTKYSSWWGIYTLPQVNENDPGYRDFIFGRETSVVRRWLRAGASAWRLDVADELPDDFIADLQAAAREEKDDAVIIGEVWEDASNKISYDRRRKYLLGAGLDGVMNYPFKDALIHYLTEGWGENFRAAMEQLRENYPRDAFYACMNGLSTHDTPRVLTLLGLSGQVPPHDRDGRAAHRLTAAQYRKAVELLKLGSLIQYTFPGSPCLYYGDEAGLEGLEDPFNRRCYPWGRENRDLVDWYRRLGLFRKESAALREGDLQFLWGRGDLVCYLRKAESETVLISVNRGDYSFTEYQPWAGETAFDWLTGRPLPVRDGKVELEMLPRSAIVIRG